MEIECKFPIYLGYYSCSVTKASITKSNVNIASFKGKHRPGKSNDDVTRVVFEASKVEYFPRNLQKTFPNMKTLVIQNCGLKEISREDLIGLEKLVHLNLNNNQLKSLPDDLFSNMPNLKQVWLGYNKIEFASSKLIERIVGNQLVHFYLIGSTSINEFYSRLFEGGCKTIQELMAKIDEKCKPTTTQMIAKPSATQMVAKPPTPKMISKAAHHASLYESAEEFLKGFNEFRLSGRFTDFVIVIGSKGFLVHKSILALQSPILAGIFEVKNGRSASKLEISEVSAEAAEAFLDYIYERKLPDAQNAVEIFKLAAKYEVANLKIICEGIIQENLDESNALEIFKLACGPHKSEELKAAAFGKIQEKFGGELDDNLINDPEKLQKIVEIKNVLDDLMNKPVAKKQRIV